MIEIIPATTYSDFEIIEGLVRQILHKFYDPVIPKEHTKYFIEKYQTAKAIEQQVKNGSNYFLLKYESLNVGYLGLSKEPDFLLLDKLYLLEDYRGKKIGKKAIEFTDSFARKLIILKIKLIVHKENLETIEFYKRMGYRLLNIVPNHFETGQIIENYEMEKILLKK
ncbi:GNAT family N-acetyltransferase [Aquimarina algicola]|uniref:GNAT family N-acetyltransferase n=1 Tax=Aquimarina algicola TaxID=2589995 RepID=A0A504J2S1_9FLAO|nr:GNAT family N-acetyltransferase [Aquimarina algicola]TPN82915.1 GNAT family N-acetyltransferase [Aquimarina algicola]